MIKTFKKTFFKGHILTYHFQKENKESVKISVKKLVDAIKALDSWTYVNEILGVRVNFKMFFTMVDSGLVNKATGNDNFRCRIGRQRMDYVRKNGNHTCTSNVYFCPYLEISMLDFGGSPTHFTIHLGCWTIDMANRRETEAYNQQGFGEIHGRTEKTVHDQILALLGLHVGEVRAGGAGTSKKKYFNI